MSIFFLEQLALQQTEENFRDGIKAAVRLHYQEYTGQESLYGPFVEALETVIYHTYGYLDLEEVVREVEAEINSEGGVRSDDDGKRHRVETFPEEN